MSGSAIYIGEDRKHEFVNHYFCGRKRHVVLNFSNPIMRGIILERCLFFFYYLGQIKYECSFKVPLRKKLLTLIVCVEIQNGDYAGDPIRILVIQGVWRGKICEYDQHIPNFFIAHFF